MIPTIPSPPLSLPASPMVRSLVPDLAGAAMKIYGEWLQDENGFDEELGQGGICHLVADAMVEVLSAAGVTNVTSCHAQVGENHVFVVAGLADGVYAIDIRPEVYEIGRGYVWRKRQGIEIMPEDVELQRIGDPMEDDAFEEAYCG